MTLEEDTEERTVEMPKDFGEVMGNGEKALSTFQALSFTAQKEYVTWITSAKREATRSERVKKAVELLSEGKKLR